MGETMTAVDHWDWDTWLSKTPDHIEGITDRLFAGHRAAREERERLQRRAWQIDPTTGHTRAYQLCWVCAAGPAHTGRLLPRFRACIHCLRHDRRQAERLGLKMLLPLMDWPAQPVLPGQTGPADAQTRVELVTLWSSVSELDEWRRSAVRLACAWFSSNELAEVGIGAWQDRLGFGPARSRACWRAYVEAKAPTLIASHGAAPVTTGGDR